MPYRKRNTTGYRRRKYSKTNKGRRNNYASAVSVPKNRIAADRYFAKLTYPDSILLSLASGLPSHWFYRGNGAFDPDQTGTGNQPTGFDQLSSIYKRYRVVASSIKVCFVPSTDGVVLQGGVVPATSTSTATIVDMLTLQSQPYAKNKLVINRQPLESTINHYMSTEKVLGMNKGGVKYDDLTAALVTASPSLQWYWHIMTDYNRTGDASSYQMTGIIEITYYIEFFDRQELAQS